MRKAFIGGLLCLILAGCGQGSQPVQPPSASDLQSKNAAGLLAPGDQPGAAGNEGLKQALTRARDEKGIRITLLEPNEFRTPGEALAYLAENGFQLVMTTDSRAESDIPALAARYPGSAFVLLNRRNMVVREDVIYHLAGFLASTMTKTYRYAILYDPAVTPFDGTLEGAFQAGAARATPPEGKGNSFLPAAPAGLQDAQKQAALLKSQGADVLLVLGGGAYREEALKGWSQGGKNGALLSVSHGEPTLTPGYTYLDIPQTSGVEATGVIEQFLQGKQPEVSATPGNPSIQVFRVEAGGVKTALGNEITTTLQQIQQSIP